MKLVGALALLLCVSVSALYSSNSPVVQLTGQNFQKTVIDSDALWLVEFYAPWCGHCKNLAPEWEKAAKALKGIIRVAAIDTDADPSVGSQYGVKGFPTIKFFGADKKKPTDYQGGRTASAIADFATGEAKKIVQQRLSGKASGSSSSSSGSASGSKKGSSKSDVIDLTSANFEEQVLKSQDQWLVEFYAPWCGHCKNLAPEWEQAATKLKGEVKVAKVDATVESELAQRYGVSGFPTIKMFPAGPKKGKPTDYQGARDASAISAWALEQLERAGVPAVVSQLTDKKVLEERCGGEKATLCVITFLPHIIDETAAQRKRRLDVLQELASANRKGPFAFLWSEGGAQFELEEKLALGFGYPALVVLNLQKNRYVVMKGVFEKPAVQKFLDGVLSGREKTAELKQLPSISKAKPWDGKDAPKEDLNDDL
eukprot:GILJ01002473.1.p1 GENE.GILJ01002473.1~~GILJ01002473.1.p1  ORF type:complete len:442 (+),score=88.83 GILJ01002473.1:48-1328(+)